MKHHDNVTVYASLGILFVLSYKNPYTNGPGENPNVNISKLYKEFPDDLSFFGNELMLIP